MKQKLTDVVMKVCAFQLEPTTTNVTVERVLSIVRLSGPALKFTLIVSRGAIAPFQQSVLFLF